MYVLSGADPGFLERECIMYVGLGIRFADFSHFFFLYIP